MLLMIPQLGPYWAQMSPNHPLRDPQKGQDVFLVPQMPLWYLKLCPNPSHIAPNGANLASIAPGGPIMPKMGPKSSQWCPQWCPNDLMVPRMVPKSSQYWPKAPKSSLYCSRGPPHYDPEGVKTSLWYPYGTLMVPPVVS